MVYFFVEDDGTQVVPGPYLIPVARPYAVLSHLVEDPVYETLNFLLDRHRTPARRTTCPALLSYIPEGTQLLGVEVAGGVATVDLSSEFCAGTATTDRRPPAAASPRSSSP